VSCLLGIVFVVGVSGLTYMYRNSSSDQSYKQATQYHLKLGDLKNWKRYDDTLATWLDLINSNSAYLQLSVADATQSILSQYKIDTGRSGGCKNSRDVTVGYYISSDSSDLASTYWVEIKGKSTNETLAETYPFSTSNIYEDDATQLDQVDRYYCEPSTRYDRQTRVNMHDSDPGISTCEDLLSIFPDAFPDYSKANATIVNAGVHYWWSTMFSGVLDFDTNYQVEFSLIYDHQDSIDSDSPDSGFFTLRLYPLESEDETSEAGVFYNENVLKDADYLFTTLAEQTLSTECIVSL
jgi:hypothetical protein